MAFEDDKQKLLKFVTDTRRFLADTVGKLQTHANVPPNVQDLLARAWDEVQDQISTVRTTIAGIPNQFDSVWTRLVEHGLTGVQLELKLVLVEAAQAAKQFVRIAKVRNSVLESLIGAIGGAGIKEFKDMLENAVDIYGVQMDAPAVT